MADLSLDFYGVGVALESSEQEFIAAVALDFSYFKHPHSAAALHIVYEPGDPDYDSLPALTCSLATPRNICFSDGDLTYIDYFGRGLNIYNKRSNRCRIITGDLELAHEIAYLTILSRVSELLESKHMHRVHALGLEHNGRGILVMLPSGGGKSILALGILRSPDKKIRLISEDSPLLTEGGMLLPFPLRIGVHPQSMPPDIDPAFTRFDKRIEFGSKINIDINYFKNRICHEAVPASMILLGVRSTGKEAIIIPAHKVAVIKYSMMNSIIGVGLYQGMEFIMQQTFRKSMRQVGLLLSRTWNNFGMIRRARIYTFIIGRDSERNHRELHDFLSGQADERG
jgi:hypothetical protein